MRKKYILRTETTTLYLDNLEQKEGFLYVEQTGNLYRILDEDETELQPDAILSNADGSKKYLCAFAWFKNAEAAFKCVEHNKNIANQILTQLQMLETYDIEENDADKLEMDNHIPKTYLGSYLFNYFGGDYVDDKKIVGVGIDVAFRPYKDKKLVQFCAEKETYFHIEEESRLIGIRKKTIYLTDAVKVSFDRKKIVKLTRNEFLIKVICEHFGWDKLEISVADYELDYAETEWLSEPWYCGKDVCNHFMETHKDDLDITDNRNAQCPGYRWLEE